MKQHTSEAFSTTARKLLMRMRIVMPPRDPDEDEEDEDEEDEDEEDEDEDEQDDADEPAVVREPDED
ncbi:hypothetical protein I6F21_17640 [Bradyrhizobium sp. NBAIM03]|nr:hypothetical protein [Bradyrhizobium sp. NBAIM14]MCA1534369.1 hypothetical protein [Bradyrhizobium sp. NBAIM03]